MTHRGSVIRKKLGQRSNYRRRRRTANLWYREKRFDNRTRPKGWLPPSLRSRGVSFRGPMKGRKKWIKKTWISC
ncbi:MAG: RRXRR domain-containing protein [Desulfobacteraceae bacterium]|nr:RRXRR domain-containing protein [Desulfobacteraceae bacterium]